MLFGGSEGPKYLVLFNKLNNPKTHNFQAIRKINDSFSPTIHHSTFKC